MSEKEKHGPHGPGCTCPGEEEDTEYSSFIDDLRELISREAKRYFSKKLVEVTVQTEEELGRTREKLRDALLTALSREFSEGCVRSGLDLAETSAFFFHNYEDTRNRILLENAGVVVMTTAPKEKDPEPNPEAN